MEFNETELRFLVGLLNQITVKLTDGENYDMGRGVLGKLMTEIDKYNNKEVEKKKE